MKNNVKIEDFEIVESPSQEEFPLEFRVDITNQYEESHIPTYISISASKVQTAGFKNEYAKVYEYYTCSIDNDTSSVNLE